MGGCHHFDRRYIYNVIYILLIKKGLEQKNWLNLLQHDKETLKKHSIFNCKLLSWFPSQLYIVASLKASRYSNVEPITNWNLIANEFGSRSVQT